MEKMVSCILRSPWIYNGENGFGAYSDHRGYLMEGIVWLNTKVAVDIK